jgi:hypothetical protein
MRPISDIMAEVIRLPQILFIVHNQITGDSRSLSHHTSFSLSFNYSYTFRECLC